MQRRLRNYLSEMCDLVDFGTQRVKGRRGCASGIRDFAKEELAAERVLANDPPKSNENLLVLNNCGLSSLSTQAERFSFEALASSGLGIGFSDLNYSSFLPARFSDFVPWSAFSKSTSNFCSQLIPAKLQNFSPFQLDSGLNAQAISPTPPILPFSRQCDSNDSGNWSSVSRVSTPDEQTNRKLHKDAEKGQGSNSEKAFNDKTETNCQNDMWRPWLC